MLTVKMYAAIRRSTQPSKFREIIGTKKFTTDIRERIDPNTLATDIERTKKKFRNIYYDKDGSIRNKYEPIARFVEVSVNEVQEVESDSICRGEPDNCSAYKNPHLRGESKCRR